MLKAIAWVRKITQKIRHDHVSAYAGQSAYFIILSVLPFLLFLLTLVQHLPIKFETIMDAIFLVIPTTYESTVISILNDIHVDSGTTILSISVITTIWTAGKGIMALSSGLNSIREIEENRSYIVIRLKAMIYTLLFAILIIFTLFVIVFGNQIYSWIRSVFEYFPDYSELLSILRSFVAIGIYISMFTLFYKFLPAKPMKIAEQIPGAIFTTAGWMISSYIFSLYVELSDSPSYMYGSLSYLILFFIYLYILMYIFFLGAELNFFLFPEKKEDYHLLY
ncbi:YihY/virulence factor BrkB family protein [Frisingicoccus sp.]|uniref:YihY/virulence factor BrkB family protein n=1 Tax=Frisingicoccus sp. TaxID=1918627 RepID=UPI002EC28665|nr:YihY/virulence factor BrkB family protein [Frisingicoccus sp.]